MALTLYLHPLAAFCHKVLIAIYENEVPFEPITIELHDPGSAALLLEKWPLAKIPVLYDAERGRTLPETSIIIEYLQQHYPGPLALLPFDENERLEARLWERFFDLYVSGPMQKIVGDRIRPEGSKDPFGVTEARRTLDTAYAMLESRLQQRQWAASDDFTIAECAAAPALFYASIVHPFGDDQRNLAAYLERLLRRPSVARTLQEARPYFPLFPYRDAMAARFLRD